MRTYKIVAAHQGLGVVNWTVFLVEDNGVEQRTITYDTKEEAEAAIAELERKEMGS